MIMWLERYDRASWLVLVPVGVGVGAGVDGLFIGTWVVRCCWACPCQRASHRAGCYTSVSELRARKARRFGIQLPLVMETSL
jgi:hypothetical protein